MLLKRKELISGNWLIIWFTLSIALTKKATPGAAAGSPFFMSFRASANFANFVRHEELFKIHPQVMGLEDHRRHPRRR